MFGRPSVADMLSVAEPAAVPMAGAGAGPASPPPSAATPSTTPPPIRPIVQARVEVPDPADQATDLVEPQEFADAETLIDEPVGEGLPIGDSAAIAVEAPPASAAADLPDLPTDLSEPHEWPTAASNEAASLEDSWFGDNFETDATEIDEPGDAFDIPEAASVPTDEGATDIFDVPDARARSRDKNATAATDPTELFEVPTAASVAVDVPEPRSVDTLEVPEPRFSAASTDVPEAGGAQSEGIGFADEEGFFGDNADEAQAGLSGFSEDSGLDDDLGFGSDAGFSDDIGFGDAADAFSDDSWDVGSSASQEVPIPKKMIFGGIGVLAAAILLTAVLSGGSDDAPIAAPAPAPAPQAAPVAAAPPPPPPPPPVVPEPETAPEVEVPAAEAVEPEKPVAEAVAARTTATEPPAVKAAKVAKATKAAKAAKAERIRSGGASDRKSVV